MLVWKCALAVSLSLILSLVFYAIRVENHGGSSSTNIELSIVDRGSVGVKKRHKQHVPKFMLDLYRNNKNYNGPDIVRSVVPKTTGFIAGNSHELYENKHMLTFELPHSSKDEIFLSAELKILSICDNENYQSLERFVKISIFGTNGELLFLDTLSLHSKNNTWLSFNLTKPMHTFLENTTDKHIKVVISIRSKVRDNFKLSLMPDVEDVEHDYPILLLSYNTVQDSNTYKPDQRPLPENVYVDERDTGNREKRSTFEEDYEEDTNNVWDDDNQRKNLGRKWKRIRNTCRRKPLYVDFTEIDFDSWIVQPSGYEAFQCHGKCFYPVAEHLSPTKHAIVQALMHSMSPSRASRSCCVPTKLDPISVLYIDSKGVLTYRYAYKDMVVSECGCR